MLLQENTMFANRYQLERLLGRGGFSEVWLAKDSYTKLDIAIKVYAPGQGMDSDGLADFSQELAGVFNLNHTNLLKPTHVDAWEGMPYLIMSFCSRGSLTKQIGKLSEQELWHVLHDVAAGLAYLHKNDIVHQDIKLDNILLDDSGNYVITDFGISTKARSTLRKSVIGGAVSGGTMAYMGPERFSKQPAPTKASDIWSLGAMMFELITGNVPFGEMGGGMQKGGAEIPDITEDISDELKTIIEQMLANETWDRPTAEKLVEIAEAQHVVPSVPSPSPATAQSTIPQQPKQKQSTSSRETQRFVSNENTDTPREEDLVGQKTEAPVKKKRKWWIWVIILIVLVIAQRIWNWYVTRPLVTEEIAAVQTLDFDTLALPIYILESNQSTYNEHVDNPIEIEIEKQDDVNQSFSNNTQQDSRTHSKDYDTISFASGYENGYVYVDLGLPSGTLWSNKNVPGGFYTYDQAIANFGKNIPTIKQWNELQNTCVWKWIGNGYKITGPNGNSIVLFANGYGVGKKVVDSNLKGFYWSATKKGEDYAWAIYFNSEGLCEASYYTVAKHSVRLVQ